MKVTRTQTEMARVCDNLSGWQSYNFQFEELMRRPRDLHVLLDFEMIGTHAWYKYDG